MQPKHALVRTRIEFPRKSVILISFCVLGSTIHPYQNQIHSYFPVFLRNNVLTCASIDLALTMQAVTMVNIFTAAS